MKDISREEFIALAPARYGSKSPELIKNPLWNYLMFSNEDPYLYRDKFESSAFDDIEKPLWCNERFGRTITETPNGDFILIGGEHEDSYDPDFFIYNDVVVFPHNGSFQMYLYRREDFLPTDNHTSTLVNDQIYIIGGLRYAEDRVPNLTTVYRLNLSTFHIEKISTSGDMPGWIYKHNSKYVAEKNEIVVSDGTIYHESKEYIENSSVFILNLDKLAWKRC
jgi:hypothetical protein